MSLLPTDSAGLQDWIARRQAAGFPTQTTGTQPAPTTTSAPTATGTSGFTGNPEADWMRLVEGKPPTAETIAQVFPQFAAMYPGSTFEKGDIKGPWGWADVIGNMDDPNQAAHWQWYNSPSSGTGSTGGYGANTSGAFGSLAQGYTDQFQSPGNFTAPTMQDAMNSPGFQFRLGEGVKALERSAASKGTLLTGGTLKDINSWAQDYASNEYDKVYDRALGENNLGYGRAWNEHMLERDNFYTNQDNQFDRYFSLAGLGQNSASNLGAYGSSYANNAGNLITGAGNAQAAGTVGSNNAWGPLWGAGFDIFNQTGWGQ